VLHHVALEVPTALVQACVEFYESLGFTETAPPETLRGRARWVERGGTQIHLLLVDGRPRGGHFALVVADHDAVVGALRRAGHAPEARFAHWGAARAYVRDPAGNLVELTAAPPPDA